MIDGAELRRLRKERGWTQTYVAAKIGCESKQTVSKIERNEVDSSKFYNAYLRLLGLPIDPEAPEMIPKSAAQMTIFAARFQTEPDIKALEIIRPNEPIYVCPINSVQEIDALRRTLDRLEAGFPQPKPPKKP